MSKSKDYIPRNDGQFDAWFRNMSQYVSVKTAGANAPWKHIPAEAMIELNALYAEWTEFYTPALKPHIKAVTTEKNLARKRAEKVIRPFVKRYLHYSPVTDGDRDNMGVPNHTRFPTPIKSPISQATGDLVFPGIHLVGVNKLRPIGGPPPDPRSDYGIRIFYGLTGSATKAEPFRLSAAPESGGELPKSLFTRKKKHLFDFDGESGNTVYICLRYESPTGGEGPFGPILSAVVP